MKPTHGKCIGRDVEDLVEKVVCESLGVLFPLSEESTSDGRRSESAFEPLSMVASYPKG